MSWMWQPPDAYEAGFYCESASHENNNQYNYKKRQSSKANDVSICQFLPRISHGCSRGAERGAVVLETRVRIARSVNHGQYDRAVYFIERVKDFF